MRIEEHCMECEEKLGRPYREVHEWLDRYAGRRDGTGSHYRHRHHQEGIALAAELFGQGGKMAAELHIRADNPLGTGQIPKRIDYF